MIIQDKALKYGDYINTDLIISGKYSKSLDKEFLAAHAMEDLDGNFREKARSAPIVAAGEFFGCGSSREAAPIALLAAGVSCVVAKSFARIFYRNAVNVGLPVIECDTGGILENHVLRCELGDGALYNLTTGDRIPVTPLPPIMIEIFRAGGLVEFFRATGGY